MKICVVSNDNRYLILNRMLKDKGFDCCICSPNKVGACDCLILSIKNELNDEELKFCLSQLNESSVVLCGNKDRVKQYFNGRVIDYARNEEFLLENARITAEATITFLHTLTGDTLKNKKLLVTGYGRIGAALAPLFKANGANVSVYARKECVREKLILDGYCNGTLENLDRYDIIINTVPNVIFTKELITSISKTSYVVELASLPYGFECMDRVNIASALPGKILPRAAASAVFNAIYPELSSLRKEGL